MDSSAPTRVPPRRAWKEICFRVAAAGLAVAVTLVAMEVVLRVAGYSPTYVNALGSFHQADEVSGHRGRPGFCARFKNPEFDALVVHDEHGFRRQEHQRPAESAQRRVFVFGDSFTWGWGVEQGEVFTDQMSLLAPDWYVANFGINCTGTVAQHALFAAECREQLRPGDTVLVMFFFNDFNDNVSGSLPAAVVGDEVVVLPPSSHLRPSWKRTCQDASYLFNYLSYVGNRIQLERRIRRATQQADAVAQFATADSPSPAPAAPAAGTRDPMSAAPPAAVSAAPPTVPGDSGTQVIVTRHFLAQWKQECERRGARFVVAYIPGMVESGEAAGDPETCNDRAFRRAFLAIAGDLGLETIDLLPELIAAKSRSGVARIAFPRDGHWNAAGHRLAAEIIQRRLAEQPLARR